MQRISKDGKKKRVLFFCSFPPPNTGQTISTRRIYSLIQPFVESRVISTVDPDRNRRKSGKFSLAQLFRIIGRLLQLRREVRQTRFDIIYLVPASSLIGHLRDVIYVWLVHQHVGRIVAHVHSGNLDLIFRRRIHAFLTRWMINHVDRICFLSESLASRSIPHLSTGRVKIVPNTTDLHIGTAKAKALIKQRLDRQHLTIVYISNMIPTKGYLDLLKAIVLFTSEEVYPIKAHFVGGWLTDKSREEFAHVVERASLTESVIVHGQVTDRDKIIDLYQKSDVFVLPTYYPVEAQPLSIIEAMNFGLPVISTDHASIPDYVIDGVNGHLVEPQNPFSIRRALGKMTDRSSREKKALAARETYDTTFHPDVVVEKLKEAILDQ